MNNKRLLITDIDNTLFDWFDMWHSSFTGLLDDLQKITKIDRQMLLEQCKRLHQLHGTSEYLFLLDELPAATGLSPEQRLMLEAKYFERRDHGLHLYEGVEETLTALKSKGVHVVAFSESKRFYSAYRLAKLGLDGLVDRLYCPADHDIPSNLEAGMMFDESRVEALSKEFKKPDPEILLQIIGKQNVTPSECLYVGDSHTKDIEMARRAGVDYLWFETGAMHLKSREVDYELLKKVTHWPDEAVANENKALHHSEPVSAIPKDRAIKAYAEIAKYF